MLSLATHLCRLALALCVYVVLAPIRCPRWVSVTCQGSLLYSRSLPLDMHAITCCTILRSALVLQPLECPSALAKCPSGHSHVHAAIDYFEGAPSSHTSASLRLTVFVRLERRPDAPSFDNGRCLFFFTAALDEGASCDLAV